MTKEPCDHLTMSAIDEQMVETMVFAACLPSPE
jgi:hypothetical protein